MTAVQPDPGAVTDPRALVEPFSGEPLPERPVRNRAEVRDVVAGARAIQPAWAALSLADRSRVLLRFHDLLLDRQSDVLDLIQRETGKARQSAFEEVGDVALAARHCARDARKVLAENVVPGLVPGVIRVRRTRRPIGVVGVIAPWNYPLTLAISDALAALVVGNTVVIKPDPQTAGTALRVRELVVEAGAPPEVVQVVTGDGATTGAALVEEVDHICFTGSTATGRQVGAMAGARLIGMSLELGGKNALYVAADADLDRAAEAVVRDCFSNTGQLCASIERLVLHETIAEEFLDLFLPRVRALRLGPALDYSCDLGSLTSRAALERVVQHVDDAVARGAVVLTGGRARPDLGPLFYEPTVLDGVPPDAVCARVETFGPVVSVRRVESDLEGVRAMNDSPFGLSAAIWSRDVRRAVRMAREVHSGTVTVNEAYRASWGSHAAEIGGVGDSGLGRRHGPEGLRRFTATQSIVIARRPGLRPMSWVGHEDVARTSTAIFRAARRFRLPWP